MTKRPLGVFLFLRILGRVPKGSQRVVEFCFTVPDWSRSYRETLDQGPKERPE